MQAPGSGIVTTPKAFKVFLLKNTCLDPKEDRQKLYFCSNKETIYVRYQYSVQFIHLYRNNIGIYRLCGGRFQCNRNRIDHRFLFDAGPGRRRSDISRCIHIWIFTLLRYGIILGTGGAVKWERVKPSVRSWTTSHNVNNREAFPRFFVAIISS